LLEEQAQNLVINVSSFKVASNSAASNNYFHLPPAKKERPLASISAVKKLQLQLAGSDEWDEF